MYHEGAVLDALADKPRWSVTYWADRGSGSGTGTLLSLWTAGKRHLVVVDDEFVTHLGKQYPRSDLSALLQQVQEQADQDALEDDGVRAMRDQILEAWQLQADGGDMAVWPLPRGAFVRWFRQGRLHVEVGEGGAYDQPMPPELVRILVDLGWNAPDSNFRNCWLQPTPGDEKDAATVAVLTPISAFGCGELPPLAVL